MAGFKRIAIVPIVLKIRKIIFIKNIAFFRKVYKFSFISASYETYPYGRESTDGEARPDYYPKTDSR